MSIGDGQWPYLYVKQADDSSYGYAELPLFAGGTIQGLSSSAGFAVEAYLAADNVVQSPPAEQTIIECASANEGWRCWITDQGKPAFTITTGGTPDTVTATVALGAGFQHVVWMWDGTSCWILINSTCKATGTVTGDSPEAYTLYTAQMFDDRTLSTPFTGRVGYIRIWDENATWDNLYYVAGLILTDAYENWGYVLAQWYNGGRSIWVTESAIDWTTMLADEGDEDWQYSISYENLDTSRAVTSFPNDRGDTSITAVVTDDEFDAEFVGPKECFDYYPHQTEVGAYGVSAWAGKMCDCPGSVSTAIDPARDTTHAQNDVFGLGPGGGMFTRSGGVVIALWARASGAYITEAQVQTFASTIWTQGTGYTGICYVILNGYVVDQSTPYVSGPLVQWIDLWNDGVDTSTISWPSGFVGWWPAGSLRPTSFTIKAVANGSVTDHVWSVGGDGVADIDAVVGTVLLTLQANWTVPLPPVPPTPPPLDPPGPPPTWPPIIVMPDAPVIIRQLMREETHMYAPKNAANGYKVPIELFAVDDADAHKASVAAWQPKISHIDADDGAWTTATATNEVTAVDNTNAPGQYYLLLTQAETNHHRLVVSIDDPSAVAYGVNPVVHFTMDVVNDVNSDGSSLNSQSVTVSDANGVVSGVKVWATSDAGGLVIAATASGTTNGSGSITLYTSVVDTNSLYLWCYKDGYTPITGVSKELGNPDPWTQTIEEESGLALTAQNLIDELQRRLNDVNAGQYTEPELLSYLNFEYKDILRRTKIYLANENIGDMVAETAGYTLTNIFEPVAVYANGTSIATDGALKYMSPEELERANISWRADTSGVPTVWTMDSARTVQLTPKPSAAQVSAGPNLQCFGYSIDTDMAADGGPSKLPESHLEVLLDGAFARALDARRADGVYMLYAADARARKEIGVEELKAVAEGKGRA